MDYRQQQQYLIHSRLWGAGCVMAWLAAAALAAEAARARGPARAGMVVFVLIIAALAVFLYYTPDYLHLTVNPEKRARWAVRVRWRLIAAVLIAGMIAASGIWARVLVLMATLWLLGANLLARTSVPSRRVPVLLWMADFALLATLLLFLRFDLLLGAVLLAAAAHLLIVTAEANLAAWALLAFSSGGILIAAAARLRGMDAASALALAAPLLIISLATAWLVRLARRRHTRNVSAAMAELIEFTGYPEDRIRHLWAVSDRELAQNWQLAAIPGHDAQRLAAWYRENSELYLFAISAYNLEYKRIRSNLKVLKMARGACLDYGAGNGELLLELARRGHATTYFDVDGTTMRFARQRAQRQGLAIRFLHEKEALAAAARQSGFDTIFSFDVLEHLPDLPGEINFLAAMLNPGGLMVFDVPAGSTRSHPMHLDHNLNVLAYLRARGLTDKRGLLLRLPFRKEEKYVFQSPPGARASSAAMQAGPGPRD